MEKIYRLSNLGHFDSITLINITPERFIFSQDLNLPSYFKQKVNKKASVNTGRGNNG